MSKKNSTVIKIKNLSLSLTINEAPANVRLSDKEREQIARDYTKETSEKTVKAIERAQIKGLSSDREYLDMLEDYQNEAGCFKRSIYNPNLKRILRVVYRNYPHSKFESKRVYRPA